VNLRNRMAGIDANIDDVQAGAEACARAANTLVQDAEKFNGLFKGPLLRSLIRHAKELQACTRDQRSALQELRNSVARLREELKPARRAATRPTARGMTDLQRP
jgi:hypothetical protein